MAFYSDYQTPARRNKLLGLTHEFNRLITFCNLVWSDSWQQKKEMYSINSTVMLYGSPGTGKTSLLQNVAIEMRHQEVKYFTYSLERLLHKDLGKSSENLRDLFDFIRSESQKEEKILVHFDDVDSVLSSRLIENESSGIRRFVNTFIKELDITFYECDKYPPPIIAVTTNIYQRIDSAVRRRFSLKFHIENNIALEEFKVWLDPIMKDLEVEGNISYGSLFDKMVERALTPYDICLIVQHLLLEKLSGVNIDFCAVEDEFERMSSSSINLHDRSSKGE